MANPCSNIQMHAHIINICASSRQVVYIYTVARRPYHIYTEVVSCTWAGARACRCSKVAAHGRPETSAAIYARTDHPPVRTRVGNDSCSRRPNHIHIYMLVTHTLTRWNTMEKPRMHFEFHLKGTYVLTAGKRSLSRSDQAGRCMHPTRRTYTEICREMHQRTVQHAPFNFAFFFLWVEIEFRFMHACVRAPICHPKRSQQCRATDSIASSRSRTTCRLIG